MEKVKFSIKPVGYRILVKPLDLKREHEVEGTDIRLELVYPEEKLYRNAQTKGIVLAVGEKAYKAYSKDYNGRPWIEVGDKIYYAQHAGKNVIDPETEEELLLLNDDDVTAVMTGKISEVWTNG